MYGYKGYIYHGYEYIKHYANAANNADTVKAIMKVLADVQKVLEIILNSIPEKSQDTEEVA